MPAQQVNRQVLVVPDSGTCHLPRRGQQKHQKQGLRKSTGRLPSRISSNSLAKIFFNSKEGELLFAKGGSFPFPNHLQKAFVIRHGDSKSNFFQLCRNVAINMHLDIFGICARYHQYQDYEPATDGTVCFIDDSNVCTNPDR